jgi:hypothetical protein
MKTQSTSIGQLFFMAVCLASVLPSALGLPVIGRSDTFENGTTQGWGGSYPGYTPLPLYVPAGGPAGPNDGFMEISTTGFHLATRNQSRAWTGDYLCAGVKAISMDLIHLSGNTDLRLRISLFGPGGMFSTIDRTPPLGDQIGWTHHIFGLTAEDLVYVSGGTGRLEDTLRQVSKVLIRHDSPMPSAPGRHPPHVRASVGIDNIAAILRDYDVGWTLSNRGNDAYRLDLIEPAHVALGELDGENPALFLTLGQRYQVTIDAWETHPFELIAKGLSANGDEVLLSMNPGIDAAFEADESVEWRDTGTGTVTFTLTNDLWAALQGTGEQSPGYRCAVHRVTMRGDLLLME